MRLLPKVLVVFFCSVLVSLTTTNQAWAQTIKADHTSVSQFDQIPDWAREAASNLRLLQLRASTGMYVSSGLCCLQGRRYNFDPTPCGDPRGICSTPYGLDIWDKTNWHFIHYRDICATEPEHDGGKVDCLAQQTAAKQNDYDVFGVKFCFTPFWEPYWSVENLWAHYRETMEQLEANYPNKKFVWWTKPLMAGGEAWTHCEDVQEFNQLVRNYAQTNNKILYDIADIEAYDENNNRCFPGCETMCTSCNPGGGGHPSDLDCRVRLAKAYWVLMAKIAGWSPGGAIPTPTPTPIPTTTPTPFPPTPTPTSSCGPLGDIDCSGKINALDLSVLLSAFGTTEATADLDDSGKVNALDLSILLSNFGKGT